MRKRIREQFNVNPIYLVIEEDEHGLFNLKFVDGDGLTVDPVPLTAEDLNELEQCLIELSNKIEERDNRKNAED